MDRILVTGGLGQIGSDLVTRLRQTYDADHIVSADIKPSANGTGPYVQLDVTDKEAFAEVIQRHRIGVVYHLASLLSAKGEADPDRAWGVNLGGLKNTLDLARKHTLRVFWPSSIAVFGPTSPRMDTPQRAIMEPSTMYGITKVTGEHLCRYYFETFDVDVRSVRYPGIISYTTPPGGGTTDYAVEMLIAAVEGKPYECFVTPETRLPMMNMRDAIDGVVGLMQAPAEAITIRSSYNVSAMSFTAIELAEELATRVPGFECSFTPDARQRIANTWPETIDDSAARRDWGWDPKFDLPTTIEEFLANYTLDTSPH